MKLVRLDIEQQRAQLDIDIVQARLHVEMPDRRMQIEQKPPEMTATSENPEVTLDMDSFKANIGLKTYEQLTAMAAVNAQSDATQGIKDIVNQAKSIGDVTSRGNEVGRWMKNQMLEAQDPEMGHSPVPPGALKMYGKPGMHEIEFSDYELSIDWVGANTPEIYVEPPSSVNVELSTQPELNITVSEVEIPASSGRHLNTEA